MKTILITTFLILFSIFVNADDIGVFTVTPTQTTHETQLNQTSLSIIPEITESNYLQAETIIWLKIIFGGIMIQSGLITALIMAVRFRL